MKKVGSCIYCHWTNTAGFISTMDFESAQDILEEHDGLLQNWDYVWDYVKWNKKTGDFTFT